LKIFELRDKEKWGAKRSSPGGGGEEGEDICFSMNKRKKEGGRAGVCGVLGNAWEKRRKFKKKKLGQ